MSWRKLRHFISILRSNSRLKMWKPAGFTRVSVVVQSTAWSPQRLLAKVLFSEKSKHILLNILWIAIVFDESDLLYMQISIQQNVVACWFCIVVVGSKNNCIENDEMPCITKDGVKLNLKRSISFVPHAAAPFSTICFGSKFTMTPWHFALLLFLDNRHDKVVCQRRAPTNLTCFRYYCMLYSLPFICNFCISIFAQEKQKERETREKTMFSSISR